MAWLEGNTHGEIPHLLYHFLVYSRITDNPFLSHLFPASLKLGFYQADDFAILCKKISHRSQYLGQGNKGNINRGKCRFLLDILRYHIANVGFLHAHNSWVVAKLPVQLAISYINRIYLHTAILKHTVCKTACRGAYIHAHLPLKTYIKFIHCFFKLQAATAYIWKGVSSDFHFHRFSKHGACFIFLLTIYINLSGHDICFCFFSGRCKSALHQHHIQSFLHSLIPSE